MWYQDDRKKEYTLDISIRFDFYDHAIRYTRENYIFPEITDPNGEGSVVLNYFTLNKAAIESITSIDDFWDKFKRKKLYSLYNEAQTIDMDEAMENLFNRFGEDFVPDKDSWYELSNGIGAKNEDLIYYFQNWKEDQFNRMLFYEEYCLYRKFGKPISLCIDVDSYYYSISDDIRYTFEMDFDGQQMSCFDKF